MANTSTTIAVPAASPPSKPAITRTTRTFILITAFLNLAGIGIINPIAPFVVGQFVAERDVAFGVSLLFTSYSLSQFLAVPTLGALSDRYGRRPILLISLLGSAVGYVIYGIGGALFMLFLGRIIDGLTGGNIAIINAYAADVTEPEERTKFFGSLGAVAGMGFVIGPALGGVIFRLTDSYAAPLYVAAVVTLFNTLWGVFAMPESLPQAMRAVSLPLARMNPFAQLAGVLRLRYLRWLLLATFIWSVGFAIAQSNFSYMAQDRFGWSPDVIGISFLVWGLVSIAVQAGLIRGLLPRYGEGRLAVAGLGIMALGFGLIAAAAATTHLLVIAAAITVTSLGSGLATPALLGLLSQAVGAEAQGRVQGGGQSVQALARVLGPLWGGWTYQQLGATSPYLSGALGLALAMFAVCLVLPALRARQPSSAKT